MTAKELQKRNHKAENLRVLQAETGQFFCESEKGKILYQVTLTNDEASCTCGDFAKNSRKDSNFRCKHIPSKLLCFAFALMVDIQPPVTGSFDQNRARRVDTSHRGVYK